MPALILLPLSHPAQAAGGSNRHVPAAAAAALARQASRSEGAPWAMEWIEIHAALPRAETTGCWRGIRRSLPSGGQYEIMQAAGNGRVQREVIAFYLREKERAEEMAAASVAITPANYRFAYRGAMDDGERQVYRFRITPRRKRDGLLKGELWLDQRTGVPVRLSGRLVKSPSFLVRRVTIIQDDFVRDGILESRLTHITADTRLAGRAQLVMEERLTPRAAAEQTLCAPNEPQ